MKGGNLDQTLLEEENKKSGENSESQGKMD